MSVKPPAPPYVGPPKWVGDKNNKPITRITIHATAGAEPGQDRAARNTVAYSKGTDRPSSYHYVCDSKESLQYVYDSYVAYHAPPNRGSIGYELCCSLKDEGKGHWSEAAHRSMLTIAARDVAALCLAYGLPIVKLTPADLRAGKRGIAGHADVRDAWGETSHWDPGPHFPWAEFLAMVRKAATDLQEEQDPDLPPLVKVPTLTVATANLFVLNKSPRANIARLAKAWQKNSRAGKPDVIACQEAASLSKWKWVNVTDKMRYRVVARTEGPFGDRFNVILVRRRLPVTDVAWEEGAPGIGDDGVNKRPRWIQSLTVEKAGKRARIINTHGHVIRPDLLKGKPREDWAEPGKAYADHAARVVELVNEAKATHDLVFVCADANATEGAVWPGTLSNQLKAAGMSGRMHKVDGVWHTGGTETAWGTISKSVTGSDTHDAVVVQVSLPIVPAKRKK